MEFRSFNQTIEDDTDIDVLQMSANRGVKNLNDADKLLLLLQSPLSILPSLPDLSGRKDLFRTPINTRCFARLRFEQNHHAFIQSSKTNENVKWLTAKAYLVLSDKHEKPIKLNISSFINVNELLARINSTYLHGTTLAVNALLSTYNNIYQLRDVCLHSNDTNAPDHLYDSHNGLQKYQVGQLISELLMDDRLVSLACKGLYRQLKVNGEEGFKALCDRFELPFANAKKLLLALHQSQDIEQANQAKEQIEVLATHSFISRVKQEEKSVPISPIELNLSLLSEAVRSFSFLPTREQRKIALNVLMDFTQPNTTSHLLYGDVGYGKTAVMAMIIHQLVVLGKSVVLLAPAQHLAIQTHRVLCETFPQLNDCFKLVTTNTDEQVVVDETFGSGVCFIGTSALLFRDDTHLRPYAIIVDEEHRFGKIQRDYYRSQGSHYIGVSATPIPRTIAGTLLGHYKTHTLTKCFVEKSFHGKLYLEEEGRRAVYQDIRDSLAQGRQILIICPLVDKSDSKDLDEMISVETLYQALTDHFGSMWRYVHGKRRVEENSQALDDIRFNRAQGLVASTAVEVGIDLPDLSDLVVFHPERFGLSQLHQLRGRIVRQGGLGFVRLYSPKYLTLEQIERLEYFLEETDGAKVAEFDAQRRGVGDILSEGIRQSGRIKQATFIRHLVISYQQLKMLYDRMEQSSHS